MNATAVTSGQTIAMMPKTMATIPRTRSITQLRSSQFFSTGSSWQHEGRKGSYSGGNGRVSWRRCAPYSDDMQKWEYATVPLIVHATKQILDHVGRGRLGARAGPHRP